jgi:hypothetical protein
VSIMTQAATLQSAFIDVSSPMDVVWQPTS